MQPKCLEINTTLERSFAWANMEAKIMSVNCCDPAEYQIRVRGELDESWIETFDGFTMEHIEGDTLFTGVVADQSALHGLLSRIGKLSLFLIYVKLVSQENQQATASVSACA